MNQLGALLRAGPDGYKGVTDYMQKRSHSYGLPSDCVKLVLARSQM